MLLCVCVCVCARVHAKLLQWYLTVCDSSDHSPQSSSVYGILHEWVAMPSSRGSSLLRNQTWVSSVSCIGRGVRYH